MNARRPAESLIEEITDSALDDDYYLVRAGEAEQDGSPNTVWVGLVMACFATLVTVAALQTSVDRPSRALERNAMIADIAAGRDQLTQGQKTVRELEKEIRALGAGEIAGSDRTAGLDVVSGEDAAAGPGVVVTLEDGATWQEGSRVSAADLRILVNELWYAGAEAIAVGEQRMTSLSAITTVDGVAQVNYRPITSPVSVQALGDAATLQDRLAAGGAGRYLAEREQTDGLRASVSSSDHVALPSASRGAESLDHAQAVEEDR
ncbi:DUF881 domain-containing protein [Aeromicrobium sp. CTD01-1L150]|uniref:DUF881 domain-containing protein n=1 Tax=Aeromicrobium sp. CTD01-1L150 TaxID=3341830 RepID=UPI0035C25AE9